MAFKPGQSGNPGGRPNEKKFRSALDHAIAIDDGKRLRTAAEKLLDLAADGQPWAVQMLADRLDGKAQQTIDVKRSLDELSDDELSRVIEGLRSALDVAEAGSGGDKATSPQSAQVVSPLH